MININTAKSPRALLYFSVLSFFSLLQEQPQPLHFHWRLYKSRVSNIIRTWNNSISTKFKKVERTIIRELYIKPSEASF